ncbi:GrpB family protein [Staphylococcus sp. NAM3COL9]|uniref:GrpB family protein n=1 Tax=Staphylococcus sp. NAM3COL9 TaxID=1667172 RepID=UPI0009E7ADB0|nr:GrpB family protein [Staphylococcus sp. NAM3COL9]
MDVFRSTDAYEINRHMALRYYLRAHEVIAKEYGELIEKLAQHFRYDIDRYVKEKIL